MGIAERVDELARFQSAYLRHHQSQQCVRRNVEWHAEEKIGAALIELAGEFSVGRVELEERVTGQQRHLVEIRDIPGGNDQAPRVRIALYVPDDLGDLIDMPAIRRRPGAP